MMDYSLIGEKIRILRVSKDLTQKELATELGVSVGYICQVERGDKCFNLKRLEEIAKFFNKPVTYFLNGAAGDFRLCAISEITEILRHTQKKNIKEIKRILEIILDWQEQKCE